MTGTFSLTIASKSQQGTRSIKVEEYKRPTFTAETQPLTSQYALGDTVQVEGRAQTYAGVPVANARVQYEVRRSAWFYANGNGQESQTGELTTGDDGTFRIPVILKGESSDGDNMFPVRYNRYTYEVTYTVTAENGETAQGSTAVCVATKPYYLKVTLPDVVYLYKGKALPQFKVEKLNAQGENLAGTGQYKVKCGKTIVAEGEFRTGTAFQFPELSTLSAGRYQFHFCTTAEDADSASFLIVREGDTLPADTASPWFFHQENNATADTVRIVFGTNGKQEAVAFCDLVTASGKTESKRIVLRNEWQHLTLAYDTAYGDGATLYLATVRDGCLYTATATVKRPIPEKRLRLTWTSFRSRLTPGSKEEWSVRATHADGTPARAQMAACLYDASLDAFARNVWEDFHLYFPRRLPDAQWRGNEYGSFRQLMGQYGARYRTEPVCRFSHWQEGLFGDYRYVFFPRRRMLARAGGMVFAEVASLNVQQDRAVLGNTNAIKITRAKNNIVDTETDGQVTVRKDFNETAYFVPALVTNEAGEVTMRFTLPESVTTWNFTALAHDAAMNFGRLDTTAVARKEFMVESALPRFLRSGDKVELPVKVTNLSEKSLSATVTLTLTNAEDGKAVYKYIRCVDVPVGKTATCPFSYDTGEFEGLLVCRVEGKAANFGDGEERYLPVLTDKEIVMRALPFSLTEKGNTLLRVDTLLRGDEKEHPALHVEVTSNPVWYALNSLPVLLHGNSCLSATEWATRLYALGLGNYVAQSNPEIRKAVENNSDELEANADILSQGLTDATPWLREGMEERERAKALRELFDESSAKAKLHTAVDKLGSMQDGDGAYAWFPGMKGNRWVTLEVATLLARMERLTGNTASHEQLACAMEFLAKDIHQSVAAMKKNGNKRQPDEFQLRYLSLYTLAEGQKDNDDVKYLLRRAEELNKELTLYGKALTALVMARMGRNEEADGLIQSLLEYTVVSKEMGRCFDTPRTRTLTSTSKILVQCAAVEALRLTGHAAESEEMRLWLMQSRRTQTWRTSQATADAVYTLLQTQSDGQQLVQTLSQMEPVYFTLLDGKGRIVGFNAKSESRTPSTSGYFKQTYEGSEALQTKNLRISKRTDGLSWGCVYATYVAKAADAPAEGTGISMRSAFEVKRGAEWQPVDNKSTLRKGDRLRRVFILTADRDYDFVRLCATRPACLDPVRPLSGYDWASGLPAYRAVKDAETQFFIEHLTKGTHRIAEEFFTDKAGTFSTGLSNAECVNAPEYRAAVPAATLQVAE